MKRFVFFAVCAALSGCQTIQPIAKGQPGPDFKVLAVSYVDSSGLYWLEKLDDDSKNGCVDKFDNYKTTNCSATIAKPDDSDAEKKCESFDARLPTMVEYERLLKDFQPNASLDKGLSDETYHEVAMAFKDDMPYASWTSTVRSDNVTQAAFFSWRKGGLQNRFEYRSVELPVRCVRRP